MATATAPKKKTAVKKSAPKAKSVSTALEVSVLDAKGKEKGKVKLPESIFGVRWNGDMVHQVVVSLLANARLPYAHTKDRSEVRGGGAKPWRQKGTGRARHGSRRSPIWIGGGVTFGPRKERNYSKKVNRKMRTKALITILSRKLKEGELIFVDDISIKEPKTKEASQILTSLAKVKGNEALTAKKKNAALILLPARDINTAKSFRNLPSVYVEETRNMNPVNLLTYKFIVIAKPDEAIKFLEGKLTSAK